MKTYILSSLASVLLFCACEKTENFELPETKDAIAGKWTEVEPEGLSQFEGSTYFLLDLKEDSTFQLHYKYWTDILRVDDPCRGIQNYYVKGKYSVNSKQLYLEGCFSNAEFSACVAKCDGTEEFRESHDYIYTDQELILDPDEYPMVRRVLSTR